MEQRLIQSSEIHAICEKRMDECAYVCVCVRACVCMHARAGLILINSKIYIYIYAFNRRFYPK